MTPRRPVVLVFPADTTLAALRGAPEPKDRRSALATVEALAQYIQGTRRLLRFAVALAGRPSRN